MSLKTLFTIAFIAVADAALILAALLMVCGYKSESIAVFVGTFVVVALVAWLSRSKPKPAVEPEREWLIWDEELEEGLSDVERDMLRRGCVPVVDPVDDHAAQMIRALSGQTAVLPERHLIEPDRRAPFGMASYDTSRPTNVWYPEPPGDDR